MYILALAVLLYILVDLLGRIHMPDNRFKVFALVVVVAIAEGLARRYLHSTWLAWAAFIAISAGLGLALHLWLKVAVENAVKIVAAFIVARIVIGYAIFGLLASMA